MHILGSRGVINAWVIEKLYNVVSNDFVDFD